LSFSALTSQKQGLEKQIGLSWFVGILT